MFHQVPMDLVLIDCQKCETKKFVRFPIYRIFHQTSPWMSLLYCFCDIKIQSCFFSLRLLYDFLTINGIIPKNLDGGYLFQNTTEHQEEWTVINLRMDHIYSHPACWHKEVKYNHGNYVQFSIFPWYNLFLFTQLFPSINMHPSP